MRLFEITDFRRVRQYSHIIWDIDRTITDENGQLSQEVAAKIINLALQEGTFHSFITGRDAQWIKAKVIDLLTTFYKFADVRNRLVFYGEVGCVVLHVDEHGKTTHTFEPAIAEHPLKTNAGGIRDKLRRLVYDPDKLTRFTGQKLKGSQEVIYDADEVGWIIDPTAEKAPPCHPYIWARSKEAFATLEKIRRADGTFNDFDQDPYADKIRTTVANTEAGDCIDLEIIGTAINVVPRINGFKLGKSWAAGNALMHLHRKLGKEEIGLDQVIAGTIAAGDGTADLDFTRPTFPASVTKKLSREKLDMIFVGGRHDLPKPGNPMHPLCDNIIVRATGQGTLSVNAHERKINWQDAMGARVISEVLDYLKSWNHFRPFL